MDLTFIIMGAAGLGSALHIFLKARKSFKEGCSSCRNGGCSACAHCCAGRDPAGAGHGFVNCNVQGFIHREDAATGKQA